MNIKSRLKNDYWFRFFTVTIIMFLIAQIISAIPEKKQADETITDAYCKSQEDNSAFTACEDYGCATYSGYTQGLIAGCKVCAATGEWVIEGHKSCCSYYAKKTEGGLSNFLTSNNFGSIGLVGGTINYFSKIFTGNNLIVAFEYKCAAVSSSDSINANEKKIVDVIDQFGYIDMKPKSRYYLAIGAIGMIAFMAMSFIL